MPVCALTTWLRKGGQELTNLGEGKSKLPWVPPEVPTGTVTSPVKWSAPMHCAIPRRTLRLRAVASHGANGCSLISAEFGHLQGLLAMPFKPKYPHPDPRQYHCNTTVTISHLVTSSRGCETALECHPRREYSCDSLLKTLIQHTCNF